MKPMVVMEWVGAGAVATSAGMVDVRLGLLAVGVWLIVTANFGGKDDADPE